MNNAPIFVSHKGLTCILKKIVRISFGLCFKNNVGFRIIHCKANR
jgi:hypothetical protein